jgi:hypothetical protein
LLENWLVEARGKACNSSENIRNICKTVFIFDLSPPTFLPLPPVFRLLRVKGEETW